MKTKLTLLFAVILPLAVHAADDLSAALQKGLFEEEANQNLPAAIKAYESLLAASDEQRKLAATALFRLGECYRKLGRTNDAVAQYQRLLRDFTDQTTLATLSRQNLRGLSVVPARPNIEADDRSSGISSEARERLRELLEGEIRIAAQFAREQRKRIEAGTLANGEEVRFERDVLGLKRQLVAVDGLSSGRDRQEWRDLLSQEIALAEKAVSLERQKLENGKSVASEVARLQRDVLILKRELVTFDSAPQTVSQPQSALATSAEAEELARTERILAQLEGWDLGQIRRILPTLVPDADFDRHARILTEAEEKIENCRAGKQNCTEEEERKWLITADQTKHILLERAEQVTRTLRERIANLRAQVNRQAAEASAAQAEAQGLLVERLELEIKTAEAEVDRAEKLIEMTVTPKNSADKPKADLLELRRQLVLARAGHNVAPQIQSEAARSESLLKQLQSMSGQELVRVLPTVAPDALLNSLLEQLSQTERKRAELKPSFAEGHPEVKSVEATLKLLNQQIAERIDGIMKGLAIKAAALKQ